MTQEIPQEDGLGNAGKTAAKRVPFGTRSKALNVGLWSWLGILAGYLVLVMAKAFLEFAIILFFYALLYAAGLALLIGFVLAIREITRRENLLHSIIALVVCSPVFFFGYFILRPFIS